MPWLPFLAFGLVLGACGPTLPAWWALAACAVAGSVAAAAHLPVAARWLAFAAAAGIGGGLAGAPVMPPPDTPRLLAVAGEVSSVRWQGYTQGFALVRPQALQPAGWTPPDRLFVRAPAQPGVRPGDLVEARGLWRRDARGEMMQATELRLATPREAGPRGAAWRAVAGIAGHRELAAALLLGRGDAPERDLFRQAGLAHIIAVSGVHLAIAAGLGWWLLRACGAGWWPRLAALGVLMAGYTWLTYGNPATLRACAMALAVIASAALGRTPHRLGPPALAAVALVAWDPAIARDIGFQLSLAAVLGIATVGLDLVALRERLAPLAPWPLDRMTWRGLLWLARAAVDGAAIGIGATLATLPLIAWHFGQAAPLSWATSLLAGAPATVALWAGLPLIALAGAWPAGPWEGLYRVVELSLDALVAVAGWGAAWLPQTPVPAPAPALVLAWPMLFLPLRDGRDVVVRVLAAAVLWWGLG